MLKRMEPIKLDELLPSKPEFKLNATGKTYKIRLFTLDDGAWIRRTFGTDQDQIGRIFSDQDWEKIVKLAYHQLEDKSDFMFSQQEVIDDDGKKVMADITGPHALLRAIQGPEEGLSLITALTRSIINSNPSMSERVEEELKKKYQTESPAGEKSLTSLPANTDGTSIKLQA